MVRAMNATDRYLATAEGREVYADLADHGDDTRRIVRGLRHLASTRLGALRECAIERFNIAREQRCPRERRRHLVAARDDRVVWQREGGRLP